MMRWEELNYMFSEAASEIHGCYPLKTRGWQNIATTDSGNTQKLRVTKTNHKNTATIATKDMKTADRNVGYFYI